MSIAVPFVGALTGASQNTASLAQGYCPKGLSQDYSTAGNKCSPPPLDRGGGIAPWHAAAAGHSLPVQPSQTAIIQGRCGILFPRSAQATEITRRSRRISSTKWSVETGCTITSQAWETTPRPQTRQNQAPHGDVQWPCRLDEPEDGEPGAAFCPCQPAANH